jgi:hypothetical protein
MIDPAELLRILSGAGFSGRALAEAAAVAEAESGRNAHASNSTGNTPATSVDRGLFQINSFWHPEVSDECAYDATCAARAAHRISGGGASWGQWVAASTPRYEASLQKYLAMVEGQPGGFVGVPSTRPPQCGPMSIWDAALGRCRPVNAYDPGQLLGPGGPVAGAVGGALSGITDPVARVIEGAREGATQFAIAAAVIGIAFVLFYSGARKVLG